MRKPVFYIEIIALVTTAITALGACTRDSTLIWDFSSSNMALSENKPTASDPAEREEFPLRYGYTQLSEAERALYIRIKKAVFNFDPWISADGNGEDIFKKVFITFTGDYPECFWLSGDWTISGYETGGERYYTKFTPNFRYTRTEAAVIKEKLEKIVAEFLAGIDPDASDYEKMLAVYDYVAVSAEYDTVSARKISNNKIDESTDLSGTIEGYFINRLAVCAGFSRATQLLLHRLGIECAYVTGTAAGGSHSWNLVKLDGEYYYIDTTWASPHSSGGTGVNYNYFCMTTDDLLLDHTPDKELSLPECGATAFNYYVYNDLTADEYNKERLAEIFNFSVGRGLSSATVKFTSRAAYDEAQKRLFTDGEIFEVLDRVESAADGAAAGMNCMSLRYNTDDGKFIITVFPKFKADA